MNGSPISQLASIFSPDQYLTDPSLMFGRADELRELVTRFSSSDASLPVLSGPPGIGKSSLLSMFRAIMMGDNESLVRFRLEAFQPDPVNRLVLWLPCSRSFASPNDLAATVSANLDYCLGVAKHQKSFRYQGFEVQASVPFLAITQVWNRASSNEREANPVESLCAKFRELLGEGVVEQVTVLLDECEQLPWIEHLIDFTRAFDRVDVRFCLAVRDVVAHRLTDSRFGDYRYVSQVAVRQLELAEVRELFDDASQRMASLDLHWKLSDDALAYIDRHANGEPWYLQMIGHELLFGSEHAHQGQWPLGQQMAQLMSKGDVVLAERRILDSKLIGLHANRYLECVRRARKREEVMRTLAKFPATLIPNEFVSFADRLRGGFRSALRVMSLGDDPILAERPRDRSWEFAEHQFRVYCRLSQPLATGCDELAESTLTAWAER